MAETGNYIEALTVTHIPSSSGDAKDTSFKGVQFGRF